MTAHDHEADEHRAALWNLPAACDETHPEDELSREELAEWRRGR